MLAEVTAVLVAAGIRIRACSVRILSVDSSTSNPFLECENQGVFFSATPAVFH